MSVSPFDVDIAYFKDVREKHTSWGKEVKILERYAEKSSHAVCRL
jgi:hypothetical protein